MLNIIMGLVLSIGGFLGKLPFTESQNRNLAFLGLFFIAWGVYRIWREVQKINNKNK